MINLRPVRSVISRLLPFVSVLLKLAHAGSELRQKASVRLTWFHDSHVPNYLDNRAAQDPDGGTLARTDSHVSARQVLETD